MSSTNRKDIHTIPNTMDIKLFEKKKGIKQTTSLEGEINICSVGYLMQKKGFDKLIFAALGKRLKESMIYHLNSR
ncbi:hypothetical protein [Enterobacter cloacae complex sp. 289A7]|uniref:hypothetical protein n=1 Tax=Enterobacter cloacae complex sp. 289A7 TaxID=3395850 RepID=UPI003CE6F32E